MVTNSFRKILPVLLITTILYGCTVSGVSEGKAGGTGGAAEANDAGETVAESSITIYPAMLDLPVGENLIPRVTSSDGADIGRLEWKSSDSAVAEVSADGNITAKAAGEAVIEAALASDNNRKATCRVRVTEEGPILLYATDGGGITVEPPDNPGNEGGNPQGNPQGPQGSPQGTQKPGDETKPDDGKPQENQPQDEPTEDIPVEQDPELDTPVEHDPSLDEYNWTIHINDTLTRDIDTPAGPVKLKVTLLLGAIKLGGKTSEGSYMCTGCTLEVKMDMGKLKEDVEKSAILKMLSNVGGQFISGDFNPCLKPFDLHAAYGPDAGNTYFTYEQVRMAKGTASFTGEGTFDISVKDNGSISGGTSSEASGEGSVEYLMVIDRHGRIRCDIPDFGLYDAFDGQLSRTPVRPAN